MTNTKYDVIVVGGGHNGLVCATYLAKSGRKVLVLEANDHLGGAATTAEFYEGYSVSSCAHWLMQLSPDVNKDMQLERHGLKLAARDLKTLALDLNGKHLTIDGDNISGEGVSAADKDAYRQFYKQSLKFSKLLSGAFKRRPPMLVDNNFTDRMTLIKLGIDMKLLGKDDMRDLMRIALINMYDVMQENFESELLKAALSMDGVLGSHMGPRSPNTVFGYLYRRLADVFGYKGPAVVTGGMGAVGLALEKAAKAANVEIRTGAKVSSIRVDAAQATGVVLDDGESIDADIVVSNADPKNTFKNLVGYPNIETGVARNVHNIRSSGTAAKLHLALDGLPDFPGIKASDLGNRLLIAPTMDYIEQAFNPVKYGEFSKSPAMDISIATVHDNTLAAPGKHVLSAIVQFAPYQLKAGWDDATKEQFKQIIIDKMTEYAPNLKELILGSELLTPADLEKRFHITGGHWHHGELSLDQIMMMRPFYGATQYKTPVDGLYLCSAGSHPGGGVMGIAGRNAANEIIKGGRQS